MYYLYERWHPGPHKVMILDGHCGFCNEGTAGFLLIDKDPNLKGYPPQYFASQLITKEWV